MKKNRIIAAILVIALFFTTGCTEFSAERDSIPEATNSTTVGITTTATTEAATTAAETTTAAAEAATTTTMNATTETTTTKVATTSTTTTTTAKITTTIIITATATTEAEQETVGVVVYRTPTGKRYHLDPDCGGKNSTATTLNQAVAAGLTPCKKCAQ